MNFAAAALAMLAERLAGYPAPLFDRIGHPVTWIGWVIGWTDRNLNRPGAGRREGRLRGTLALALILAAAALPAWALAGLLGDGWIGWIVQIALATSLIAQKSLRDHVRDVRTALDRSLDDARRAVSRIVGRDPAQLDESGIARAALESLAENASDGVVAPVFWLALLGLPGLAAYKAINTADSMIGHRSETYIHFGWASARTDDLVNIPASRLTGLTFAAATPARFGEILCVIRRYAPRHGCV